MSAAHLRGRVATLETTTRAVTPIRWEYMRLAMLPAPDDIASLNKGGADGWEVVHADELHRTYLLKRRVRDQ